MWYLTEEKSPPKPGPKYWLGGVAGGGRTIGRKHVDIRLKASSVSRTHAKINILKAAFYTPSVRRHSTSISVQDSSAYGTFLKYPSGHASNRGEVDGHHRRLDKDTPTDVCEGALLAFGAPSAWWRVAWERIAVCPTRLTGQECARLDNVAAATSLEVVDGWSEDVTHLITNQCVPTSFKFLSAVAYDRHIVTSGWVEAVNSVVTEACKNITDAGSDDAAVTATNLPDENKYVPPFSTPDEAVFPRDALTSAFEPSKRERRKGLFKGIAFAFAREERRSKWSLIIAQLHGTSTLAGAVRGRMDGSRTVYVREDGKEAEVDNDRAWMPESAVIGAILSADLNALQSGLDTTAGADVTDVATPGPLDVDSDVDSDDSEGTQSGKNQRDMPPDSKREDADAQTSEPNVLGVKRGRGVNDSPQKRQRGVADKGEEGGARAPSSEPAGGKHQADKGPVDQTAAVEPFKNAAINEREFFKVPDLCQTPASAHAKRDELDVRPFRRKTPPTASPIPLKRVRVMDDSSRADFEPSGESRDTRRDGRSRRPGNAGAIVVDSDEE